MIMLMSLKCKLYQLEVDCDYIRRTTRLTEESVTYEEVDESYGEAHIQ